MSQQREPVLAYALAGKGYDVVRIDEDGRLFVEGRQIEIRPESAAAIAKWIEAARRDEEDTPFIRIDDEDEDGNNIER